MSNQPQSSEVAWKYLSGTTDLAGPGTPEYVDVDEEQQLHQKMIERFSYDLEKWFP